MKRTSAELQMEELRRLRETLTKGKAQPSAPAKPAPAKPSSNSSAGGKFELSEAAPKKRKDGPSLPISASLYRQLIEQQRAQKSFRRRRDMGDWAAELLLALPFETHKLSAQAKAELFQRMQTWAKARGLQ